MRAQLVFVAKVLSSKIGHSVRWIVRAVVDSKRVLVAKTHTNMLNGRRMQRTDRCGSTGFN